MWPCPHPRNPGRPGRASKGLTQPMLHRNHRPYCWHLHVLLDLSVARGGHCREGEKAAEKPVRWAQRGGRGAPGQRGGLGPELAGGGDSGRWGEQSLGTGPALGAGGEERDRTHWLHRLWTPGLEYPQIALKGPAPQRSRGPAPRQAGLIPRPRPRGRNPPVQQVGSRVPMCCSGPTGPNVSLAFGLSNQ